MTAIPLVSIVTFLPGIAGLVLLLMPRRSAGALRSASLAVAVVTFLLSLPLYVGFDPEIIGYQFEESRRWMPTLGASYHVGIDGISLLLVLLTTFLTPVALAAAWGAIEDRVKEFVATMLILETGMLGVFVSLDLFLFYVFWEAMLIPMYFIIGVWGGPNRIYAAVKFVLYTMVGSLLMLVAILALYYQYGGATGRYTFDLPLLTQYVIAPGRAQDLMFLAFALAFAIKVPLFPFHTWLPDAHVEAPTAGSVILAGVLLKMGTYGFLRFCLPLFPDAAMRFGPLGFTLAVMGVDGPARHEEARGLFEREPSGLRDARDLHPEPAGPRRRADPDGEPRALDRRAVPDGRDDLRAPPLAAHRRLRRPLASHPGVLGAVPGRHVVVARLARIERLRRRVPDPARRLPEEPVDGGAGEHRDHLRGGLSAVDVSACGVR
jgi:hypothetical protein